MSTLPETATPAHSATSRNQSEQLPDAVIAPITQQDSGKRRRYSLARRLHVVFNDLGLLDHVPSGWLQPSPDGLSFASMSVRESDKFVLALEDLAQGRPPSTTVSPDQLRLF